ncbi:MAG: CoA ester lyase [Alphaproteobacteria bacterium]|nr:CoA ester lyase [Alphaproteobacteria bacterium]
MVRLRRSQLYMPGSSQRALDKASQLAADGLILDLEDAVAPDSKLLARRQIAAMLSGAGSGRRRIVIRINALDSEWWRDDAAMAVAAAPGGILVPKVSGRNDLRIIAEVLRASGAPPEMEIWAMIETARAVLQAGEIAAASGDGMPRLAGFVLGPNDLARETGIRMTADSAAAAAIMTQVVVAARAYGIAVLDGPYSDIADAEGFAAACARARDFGFDGKTLIHPCQIRACNAIFTPSAQELARARRIVAAFDLPENAGKGAIQLDGQMVERLHEGMAQQVIAIAEAIAARESA